MKKSITLILVLISLCSCMHLSDPKTESGIVVEKQYAPKMDASGMSINTGGELGFHTLSENEKFIIVFKCEHKVVFSTNNKNVYFKLNKGDTVNITYQELLLDKNNELVELKFIDANKIIK